MMSLERYFIFSSYAMFMTGYVMLAPTRQLDFFSLGLFAVVLNGEENWVMPSKLPGVPPLKPTLTSSAPLAGLNTKLVLPPS